jgi:hypothetical protein
LQSRAEIGAVEVSGMQKGWGAEFFPPPPYFFKPPPDFLKRSNKKENPSEGVHPRSDGTKI